MPISVRYGDTGDLGALAVRAGQGREFDRRFAAEQQIIQNVRNQQMQAEQQRLEAMRLQAAASFQRTAQSGTSPRAARSPTSPLSQAIRQEAAPRGVPESLRQLTPEGSVSGGGTTFTAGPEGSVSGTKTVIDAAGEEIQVPITAEDMQQRGGSFAGRGKQAIVDPVVQQKLDLIDSYPGLPEEEKPAMRQLVEQHSPAQLGVIIRNRIAQLSRSQPTIGEKTRVQDKELGRQLQEVDKKIRQIEKRYDVTELPKLQRPFRSSSEYLQQLEEDPDMARDRLAMMDLMLKRSESRATQTKLAEELVGGGGSSSGGWSIQRVD